MVSKPAADEQRHRADDAVVGEELVHHLGVEQRGDHAGARLGLADLHVLGESPDHAHGGVDHAVPVGAVGCRVHLHVRGLAVDLPVGERQAEHRHGEHRGHDVGEVVDEVEPTGLDHVVDARAREVLDERIPHLHRRRRQERVEDAAVLRLLGRVHLDEAAARRPALGDRDALVAVALAVGVVVVRQEVGALRDRAQHLVAGDDPEAVVLAAPRDRALLAQLVRLRRVGLPVLGECWSNSTTTRSSDAIEPPGVRWPVRANTIGGRRTPPPRDVLIGPDWPCVNSPRPPPARRDPARRPALLRDDVDAAFARLRAESPIHRTTTSASPPDPTSGRSLATTTSVPHRELPHVPQRAEHDHRGLRAFGKQHPAPRSARAHPTATDREQGLHAPHGRAHARRRARACGRA